jgi:hypothetical protein
MPFRTDRRGIGLSRPIEHRSAPREDFIVRRQLTIAALVTLVGSLAGSAPPAAADDKVPEAGAAYSRHVRVIETADAGVRRPSGLAWSATRGAFVVVDDGATIGRLVTPLGSDGGAVSLPAGASPPGIAFDQTRGRLVGDQRAAGAAVDANGRLWLLDAATGRISRTDGGAAFTLGRVARPRGLAIHPATGHLFTLSAASRQLIELDIDGRIVSVRDLAGAGLRDPRAIAVAPSADNTDAADVMRVYIADAGSETAAGTVGAGIHEVALQPTVQFSVLAGSASLVRTIATHLWDPASPDPSGLTYNADEDRLALVDGEVDETTGAGFHGANGWLSTRNGSVTDTFDVTAFNEEAVGIAYDASSNRYFISNDSAKLVFVINPGADGLPGTGDDTRTQFSTNAMGSSDPEGLAFGDGDLFIADGVGGEVYRVDPGANGTFQGSGDDVITHFDVSSLGQPDPEGIDYDSSSGHLWIVSNDDNNPQLLEITPNGVAVQSVDIPFSVTAPGGLAVAPASSGTGNNIYVADRGVDNNNDPTENDGLIYEIRITGAPDLPSGTLALPASPIRLIDTRDGTGLSGRFVANTYRTFNVAGSPAIPNNAIASTGNVTAVGPTAGGYVSVLPEQVSGDPPVSNVNFRSGVTRPNNFVAPLASDGRVAIVYVAKAGARTHLILDVTGYFLSTTGEARYVKLAPARIMDSRDGSGGVDTYTSGSPQTFDVAGQGGVPANAVAVAGNLTVTNATRRGFAALTTEASPSPATSTLNFEQGETIANGIVIGLASGGSLSAVIGNGGGQADLIFDVTGYFVAGSTGAIYHVLEPSRLIDTRSDVGLSNSFQAQQPRTLDITPATLPNGTAGITGNLTVVGSTRSGFVAAMDAPNVDPDTSTINFSTGQTLANGVVAPLAAAGGISFVYVAGSSTTARTHLLLDVTGYFQ